MYGYEAERIIGCDLELYKVKSKDGASIGKIFVIDRKDGFKEIHYLIPNFKQLPLEEQLSFRALIEEWWIFHLLSHGGLISPPCNYLCSNYTLIIKFFKNIIYKKVECKLCKFFHLNFFNINCKNIFLLFFIFNWCIYWANFFM